MDVKKFKQQLLDELYRPYKKCTMCPLGEMGRTKVVFGEGNPDAALMFVGEGPGKEEDEQGRPFVGRSGKLLNRTLELVGIKREEVFITNVVKCRPPGNRTPTPLESGTCKNLLLYKQIKIVQPKIICTLGTSALVALIDESKRISDVRGKLITKNQLNIFPTYHPAYILRNQKEANTFLNDFRKIVSYIKQA